MTADGYAGRDELTVTFTAVVTGDKTGIAYDWDFGDGSPHVTTAAPSHTYSAPGYYTVRLVVSNDAGESYPFTGESMITILPSTCYVRAVGESVPTLPYATPGTAANSLYDVLSIAPSLIDVGEGDIEIGSPCDITQPIVIRGKGPDKTRFKMVSCDMSQGVCAIYLKNKGAVLADAEIRIDGSCNWGGPIGMTGGLMTNCVVRGNYSNNLSGVAASGGKIIGCSFLGNTNNYSSICAACISGGGVVIQNCRFEDNTSVSSGSALTVNGNYSPVPAVRNCLFTRNRQGGENAFGVINVSGAVTIDNCTIVSNGYAVGQRGGGLYVGTGAPAEGVLCRNTLFCGNICGEAVEDIRAATGKDPVLTACLTGVDPKFKNAGAGNYHLRQSSPCVNAGEALDWMDGATDLDGEPRIRHGKPDIGCYERRLSGFAIIAR